ncbi:hypothetical protein Hdeb2414_s0005g00174981 [Helianthus debilis subsp. tardiflorus]
MGSQRMRVIYESSSDQVRVKPVTGFHMNGSHGLNAWAARVLPLEWKTLNHSFKVYET